VCVSLRQGLVNGKESQGLPWSKEILTSSRESFPNLSSTARIPFFSSLVIQVRCHIEHLAHWMHEESILMIVNLLNGSRRSNLRGMEVERPASYSSHRFGNQFGLLSIQVPFIAKAERGTLQCPRIHHWRAWRHFRPCLVQCQCGWRETQGTPPPTGPAG
jgi:hypothetical protein